MSGALWIALLAGPGTDLEFEARSLKVGEGIELRVLGRARGLPDGAVVRLRFRRLVNRIEGGRIVPRPEASSRVRRAGVRREAFSHREVFGAPADVEVEAVFDPAEQALDREAAAATRVVRIGLPSEVAAVLRREGRALREALAEARLSGGEGGRERARRRLAGLRGDEPAALFTATADRLAAVLEGFLSSGPREKGAPGFHGRPLGLRPEDLPTALDAVGEIFERERVILIAREAGRLRGTDRGLAALEAAAEGDESLLTFLREAGREGFGSTAAEVESRFREGLGWDSSRSHQ
jgi:hypothetical protein